MQRVGVWEGNEGLRQALEADMKKYGVRCPGIRSGRHPAELAGEVWDLLAVSPGAAGWAGARRLNCRLLLLPGAAAPLARGMQVEGAVSYGSGPRNTITLSSLEEGRIGLAVQRELVTVEGGVVERQELVLPYPGGETDPEQFMARVGVILLLGGKIS